VGVTGVGEPFVLSAQARTCSHSAIPTGRCSAGQEMHAWTAHELARFLRWADDHDSDIAMAWRLLAYTGMRRGEALSLRWRDVDLDAGRVAVRRSVGVVKDKGNGEQFVEGETKTGQSRVVDLDAGTVAALRAYRAVRGLSWMRARFTMRSRACSTGLRRAIQSAWVVRPPRMLQSTRHSSVSRSRAASTTAARPRIAQRLREARSQPLA
jgi:integrase